MESNPMYETIHSLENLAAVIQNNPAVLVYFSNDACNVCKVLKPKIAELFQQHFPAVKLFYVHTEKTPEIPAQHTIFGIPTIIVFLTGKEFLRETRNMGLNQIKEKLERSYKMLLD